MEDKFGEKGILFIGMLKKSLQAATIKIFPLAVDCIK